MKTKAPPISAETLKILKLIKKKYKYSSTENVINHYLERVFPDPSSLSDEDKLHFYEIKTSLGEFYTKV